jgi:lipopolysaccharide transport system permease protein
MRKKKLVEGDWDLVLEPKSRLFNIDIREIIRYRDLVWLFVKRDFATVYKQTILGPLWFVINPLLTTVMYTFVFGNLAKIGTDGIPFLLFYYGGTMLWTYFASCLTNGADVFTTNSGLFGKVYFPRLVVPISKVFSNMISLGIQFVTLMAFYVYYLATGTPLRPSPWAFALPLLVAWLAALGTGLGMIISSLTTKYRDLRHLLHFGISLAMYATPIIYPLSQIPEKYAWAFYLNPVSAPVELFRIWFYGPGQVPGSMIAASLGMTAVFLLLGLILFGRNERTFIDVA